MMKFAIINQSDLDISELEPLIQSMMSFGQDRLGFQDPPSLFLRSDSENASDFLGKTGFYSPMQQEITAFVDQRHPKDILRSISHELVHHAQNCRGEFDEDMELGEGYAQKNPHLREMEKEAYLEGNLILRDWEDNHKKQLQESIYYDSGYIIEENKRMSTKNWKDRELNILLMEKWGYKLPTNEGKKHDCANHVKENRSGREGRCINHTLLEDGTVTHYTVEFLSEIVENIPVDKLTILEMKEHMHSPAKRDDDHDETKPRTMYEEDAKPDFLDLDKDGDTEEPMKNAVNEQDDTPSGGDSVHVTVKKGDTLGAIAKNHGVTADAIAKANKLDDPDKIKDGQKLYIPPPPDTVKEQEVPDIDVDDLDIKAPAAMAGGTADIDVPEPTPPQSGTDVEVPDAADIKLAMKESEVKFRKIVREVLRKRLKR